MNIISQILIPIFDVRLIPVEEKEKNGEMTNGKHAQRCKESIRHFYDLKLMNQETLLELAIGYEE